MRATGHGSCRFAIGRLVVLAMLLAAWPAARAETPANTSRERAILLEEDAHDAWGARHAGTVTWRTMPDQSNGQQQTDVAVRADVDIPELGVRAALLFRRNTDPTLPASHTAELSFVLPPDVGGGAVANVPGMMLKISEQAHGTPIAGVSVKVTEGVFLIGFSNQKTDRTLNVQLLSERDWFDIPIVYANRHRAILAIEKGATGHRAFQDAFSAWGEMSGGGQDMKPAGQP
jgi:hypothetical protein